ncbi:hypothetical protein D3C87_1374500 [compost metagenome]
MPAGSAKFISPTVAGSAASLTLLMLRARFAGVLSASVIFTVALALAASAVNAKLAELPPAMVRTTVSRGSMV